MIRTMTNVILMVLVVSCMLGCGKGDRAGKTTGSKSGKGTNAKLPPRKTISQPVFEGTVAEITNASRYSYIRIASESGERWVAIPEIDLPVGKKISVYAGSAMTNFHSQTLGRTFTTVYFSPGLSDGAPKTAQNPCVLAGGKVPVKVPSTAQSGTMPASGTGDFGQVVTGRVVEVLHVKGYTYVHVDSGSNQVWAAAPAFDVAQGDKVSVRLEMAMRSFVSSSLKRTFDVLYMAEQIPVIEKAGSNKVSVTVE
ncbi:MAG: hypothetical protein WCN95_10055 [bacterium]